MLHAPSSERPLWTNRPLLRSLMTARPALRSITSPSRAGTARNRALSVACVALAHASQFHLQELGVLVVFLLPYRPVIVPPAQELDFRRCIPALDPPQRHGRFSLLGGDIICRDRVAS